MDSPPPGLTHSEVVEFYEERRQMIIEELDQKLAEVYTLVYEPTLANLHSEITSFTTLLVEVQQLGHRAYYCYEQMEAANVAADIAEEGATPN